MDRFKMIASGYVFLINNGKILLLRRFHTGYQDGKYGLPAGHVEDNESLTNSTVREAQEEVGVIINPKDLTLVHVMHRKEFDIRMDFFFVASRWQGEPKNNEPHKADDLEWFGLNDLPPNTIGYIRQAIESYQKKIFYSESGW